VLRKVAHTVSTSGFNSADKIEQRYLKLFREGGRELQYLKLTVSDVSSTLVPSLSKVRAKFSVDFYRTLTEITKFVHVDS
jgi:hypothetical protein